MYEGGEEKAGKGEGVLAKGEVKKCGGGGVTEQRLVFVKKRGGVLESLESLC